MASLTGLVVRRTVGGLARRRLDDEIARMRAENITAADLVKRYAPIVVDNLSEISERAIAGSRSPESIGAALSAAGEGDFDAKRLRLSYLNHRAQRLVDAAAAAGDHLAECERAADGVELRIDDRIDEMRSTAEQRVDDLIDEANAQANAAVEAARQRLAEVEQRAEAHVADVSRRARIAADQMVAQAEARRSSVAARALAELDAARIASNRASAAAAAAVEKAEAMARSVEAAAEATDREAAEAVADLARARRRRAKAGQQHDDVEQMSRNELYRLAKELGVPGRSSMSKTELIAAVRS